MTPLDRKVRAAIYTLFAEGSTDVDVTLVADRGGWDTDEVAVSFSNLSREHRVVLTPTSDRVWMAHPFSGLPTPYTAEIGERSWFANCAWDALAILALLGDGIARGEDALVWNVVEGVVSPDGLVHLLVPARRFWDDIGFT